MTTKRLLLVQVLLVLGLGSVAFLPKVANSTPQGISLTLPSSVGVWFGEDQKITEQELAVLAKDTEFARKLYTNGRGDQIFASLFSPVRISTTASIARNDAFPRRAGASRTLAWLKSRSRIHRHRRST